jgi:hypothetical protein
MALFRISAIGLLLTRIRPEDGRSPVVVAAIPFLGVTSFICRDSWRVELLPKLGCSRKAKHSFNRCCGLFLRPESSRNDNIFMRAARDASAPVYGPDRPDILINNYWLTY